MAGVNENETENERVCEKNRENVREKERGGKCGKVWRDGWNNVGRDERVEMKNRKIQLELKQEMGRPPKME